MLNSIMCSHDTGGPKPDTGLDTGVDKVDIASVRPRYHCCAAHGRSFCGQVLVKTCAVPVESSGHRVSESTSVAGEAG